METFFHSLCEYTPYAHWIILALFLLAGVNIPVSADILLIAGGAIASSCPDASLIKIYIFCFLGSWLAAWEAYWIGSLFGPKLYKVPWIRHFITFERMSRLRTYYDRFGIFTFIVGRFIPGGFRNALFMTSGLSQVPFVTFIIRDLPGCLISSAAIFGLGYAFGQNYQRLFAYLNTYQNIFFILAGILILLGVILYFIRRKTSHPNS